MTSTYKKIAVKNLSNNCGLITPAPLTGHYNLQSSATNLMVDFSKQQAITIGTTVTVNDALETMRTNNIRALNIEINPTAIANTFSDLERVIFASREI